MTPLADKIPEPTSNWTQSHDPNPVEGIVVARREVYSTKFDKSFAVLEVGEDDGRIHEVPCGRADLATFVRRYDPQEGDRVALRWWGQQGMRHVYTGLAVRGAQQERLEVGGFTEETPPLTDDDYAPDEEVGA